MPAGRVVTLVLCTGAGDVLGSLPPFDALSPWWPDSLEVVAGARAAYGVDVVVLRLLSARAELWADGGPVTYLAQVDAAPDHTLSPWPGDPIAEEPHRATYARPGGPQADVAWARAVLADRGLSPSGAAEQVRTWNLSSIWWLPTGEGPVWLKVVPPFFAHEGALLEQLGRLHPGVVPDLLGRAGARMLLRDIPGEDRYDATGAGLSTMVAELVGLQAEWLGKVDELFALGLPDWRPAAYLPDVHALLDRRLVDAASARRLEQLVLSLPERLAAVEACGVPDTLLHGDFHPGNVRGHGADLRILDWGDSGVGHPLLDQTAFCARLGPDDRAQVLATWDRLWRTAVPGCDPARAAALLEPVAALRAAVVYQRFLDDIEPAERVYHERDPVTWLLRAAELA